MAGPKIDADKEAIVRDAIARGESVRSASRAAECSLGAAQRVGRDVRGVGVADIQAKIEKALEKTLAEKGIHFGDPGDVEAVAASAVAELSVSESGDSRNVEFGSDSPVHTLEDAVKLAGVDLSVWRVDRWECGGWQVSMKLKEKVGNCSQERPIKRQLWKVRLYLKRILPKSIQDATDAVFSRLATQAPAPKPPKLYAPADPHLCVLDLVDVHFGKLAWAKETGQNYDLKIAEAVYRNAVRDVIARASSFDVEEFLVPLGSDFLHIDNAGGTTTAGTPQDVDGRVAKILETAEMAVIAAVEELAGRARRVVLRWVPGNHDRLLSYCLARTIAAHFRSHPGVTVDVAPTARKYHRYHATLIGLTHGDEEKHGSLPALMAQEAKQDWAETDCREWHIGHLHKSKRLEYLSLDTHGGIPVRTLRSLSAVDAWHYRKGYVGTQRAAEAYFYDRSGFVGFFCANARETV